jgi:glycine hydroxymethyltransferase
LNPSGVRLGSPAVTTRGFREAEMRQVAALIAEAINDVRSKDTLLAVRRRVLELAERFPLYPWKLAPTTA